MNQGLYGFPPSKGLDILDIAEFDASGYYIIPQKAKTLRIVLVGGGAGGGSGRVSNANTAASGGLGGGGGAIITQELIVADFPTTTTLNITIGAGGNGGAAIATTQTNGSLGSNGGNSFITINEQGNYFIMHSPGGLAATTTAGTAAITTVAANRTHLVGAATVVPVVNGSATSITAAPADMLLLPPYTLSLAGAAGGGISTGNVGFVGGNISLTATPSQAITTTSTTAFAYDVIQTTGTSVIIAGGAINSGGVAGKGQDGKMLARRMKLIGAGSGGAGGGGGNTVGGGNGGNGYRGGGGGGGGAGRSAAIPSGAGGNGGNGYCCIIAIG